MIANSELVRQDQDHSQDHKRSKEVFVSRYTPGGKSVSSLQRHRSDRIYTHTNRDTKPGVLQWPQSQLGIELNS